MACLMIVPVFGFEPPANQWEQFTPAVRSRLERQGVTAASFDAWRERIVQETKRRERDGEGDHLVHYALLSRSFTKFPPIEPALSAKQFVEQGKIPDDALLRLAALQTRLQVRTASERLQEMQSIAEGRDLRAEYSRAMRFLYAKEFQHRSSYAQRGHSTDTAVAANFAVWEGLSVLHAIDPDLAIRRVLVVGPGLDFAPRTAMIEMDRPQSYQPFAILDALLGLGFHGLTVHCLDINPRVLRFFDSFGKNPVLELPFEKGNRQFAGYWRQLGSKLGNTRDTERAKLVDVRQEYADAVSAENLNIVADAPTGGYDLAIATNVLVYYDGAELTVALAHIAGALRPGGYLLHNDLRNELDRATQAVGLEAVAARTVQTTVDTFDSFAIYRRENF